MTRCINKEDAIQPDIWVLIDQEGERTLFRLVEVEDARQAARVVRDRQLPVMMVDVALPSTEQLGPTLHALSGRGRLIVLNVHTVSGTHAAGVTVPRPATTDWHPRLLWAHPRRARRREGTDDQVNTHHTPVVSAGSPNASA